MIGGVRVALVAGVLVSLIAPARADNKDDAKAAFAEGQQRYAAGEYLVAADKFETAYALDPDPAYLFNVAQAYRFGNACAKAAAAYHKFLAAVPNPPNKAKVDGFVEQAEDCASKQAAAEHPQPPHEPPVHEDKIGPPPPPPHEGGSAGLRIGGLAVGGLGVVALGVATYYTVRASQLSHEREDICASELAGGGKCAWDMTKQDRADSLKSDGEAAQTRARVSWVVGGAFVAGGAVMYLLGRRSGHESAAQYAVVPSANGAMALGEFRF